MWHLLKKQTDNERNSWNFIKQQQYELLHRNESWATRAIDTNGIQSTEISHLRTKAALDHTANEDTMRVQKM
jgi:hypothetical protein